MQTEWMFGLAGGLLIGIAGAMFLLINGRIMGVSGILGGLIDGSGRVSWRERAGFVAGLVLVPGLAALVSGGADTWITSNLGLVVLAGALVGLGTRIANGCTSGHGVCGISRLSPRGIMATLCYIGAGAATVVVLRTVGGF